MSVFSMFSSDSDINIHTHPVQLYICVINMGLLHNVYLMCFPVDVISRQIRRRISENICECLIRLLLGAAALFNLPTKLSIEGNWSDFNTPSPFVK